MNNLYSIQCWFKLISTNSFGTSFKARKKLQSLQGITRLQALARGHLVRRQAVATLQSVRGIIKIQALVRGQKVRHYVGREIHESETRGKSVGVGNLSHSSLPLSSAL